MGLLRFLEADLSTYEYKICVAQVFRLMDALKRSDSYFELFQKQAESLLTNLDRPNFNDDEINKGLHALKKRIRKDKKIGSMPVAAFLVEALFCYEKNPKITMIKAVVFITSYYLNGLEVSGDLIERALREVRLMIADIKVDMIRQLPDFTQNINTIFEEIKESRNNSANEKINWRMGPIQVLLSKLLKNRPENDSKHAIPNAPSPKEKKERKNYRKGVVTHSVEGDPFICTTYVVSQQNGSSGYVDEQESEADQNKVSNYMTVKVIAPHAVTTSLALQNQRAKQIANQLARREKQLSADWSQLTDYEVETFLKESFFQLLSDHSDAFVYLLISLFSGKHLAEIVDLPHCDEIKKEAGWRQNNESVELIYYLDLPKHHLEAGLASLIRRSDSEIAVSLPSCIGQPFLLLQQNRLDSNAIDDAAKAELRRINHKYNTRISPCRLRNHMRYWLSRNGVDEVEITLLHGASSRQEAGIYYYQVKCEELAEVHNSYCSHLLHKIKKKSEYNFPRDEERWVGSQLQLIESKVAILFKAISQRVDEHRRQGNQSIVEFHNWYTIFILHLLNISTGHRPVRNPYDDIKCFDLEAETIFISDKEVRSELAARTLVLPEVAVKQMVEYLRHLKELKKYFIDINQRIFEEILAVEEGRKPLLFFLESDRISFVIPALLEKKLDQVLPLPFNWHRHFMRSKLRQLGVSGQGTDAWMGHAAFGGEAFARFSGIAMSDLNDIAERINEFLTIQLDIAPLDAWSHRS